MLTLKSSTAGDPQEAEALHTAFFSDRDHDVDDILYVGSVKTVIGKAIDTTEASW